MSKTKQKTPAKRRTPSAITPALAAAFARFPLEQQAACIGMLASFHASGPVPDRFFATGAQRRAHARLMARTATLDA